MIEGGCAFPIVTSCMFPLPLQLRVPLGLYNCVILYVSPPCSSASLRGLAARGGPHAPGLIAWYVHSATRASHLQHVYFRTRTWHICIQYAIFTYSYRADRLDNSFYLTAIAINRHYYLFVQGRSSRQRPWRGAPVLLALLLDIRLLHAPQAHMGRGRTHARE